MTELPNVYQLTHVGTAPKFNAAFLRGMGAGAPPLVTDGVLRPGPVALWGEHKWYPTLHKAIAEGRTWYYGDHAYFGRGFYYRVTKNALQIDARDFEKDPAANAARFEQVSAQLKAHKIHNEIEIFPSRADPNGFVMICPPSEPLSIRSGFTQRDWIKKAQRAVRAATNRRIEFRMKPKINRTPAPFLEAMKGAWCAVTYTGNIATEAMLGGYPCITTGPHPAGVFGNTKIANIEKVKLPPPDVLKNWAGFLCRNQWTLEEIARGDCWKAIQ